MTRSPAPTPSSSRARRQLLDARLRAGVLGLVIVGMLAGGSWETAQAATLSAHGSVVDARVVASGNDEPVRVRLPAPLNRDVDLIAWAGTPPVGQIIRVRYHPNDPALAEQDGTQRLDFGEGELPYLRDSQTAGPLFAAVTRLLRALPDAAARHPGP